MLTGHADGPIYVGHPLIGYEQEPVSELPEVGQVRFIGVSPETRCHVYEALNG